MGKRIPKQKQADEIAALFQIAVIDSGVDAAIEAVLPYVSWHIVLKDAKTYEAVKAKLLALCKNSESYQSKGT